MTTREKTKYFLAAIGTAVVVIVLYRLLLGRTDSSVLPAIIAGIVGALASTLSTTNSPNSHHLLFRVCMLTCVAVIAGLSVSYLLSIVL